MDVIDKTGTAQAALATKQPKYRFLFIQPFHHWYISARHTQADLEKAIRVIAEALAVVAEKYPVK